MPIKVKLKRKYTDPKPIEKHTYRGRTGPQCCYKSCPGRKKRLQKIQVALKVHYEYCAANGYMEQIPVGLRPKYSKDYGKSVKDK